MWQGAQGGSPATATDGAAGTGGGVATAAVGAAAGGWGLFVGTPGFPVAELVAWQLWEALGVEVQFDMRRALVAGWRVRALGAAKLAVVEGATFDEVCELVEL